MTAEVVTAEVLVEARPSFHHPSAAQRALEDRVSALVDRARVRHPRAVKRVLEKLAAFVDGNGRCFCSHEILAARASFSTRHIARVLDQAEAAGLLVRAVPRFAARLVGTATEFALPWWALTVERGLAAAQEVRAMWRRGPVARITREVAAGLVALVEDMHPVELVRRVASRVGPVLSGELVRTFAGTLVPREGRGLAAAPVGSLLHATPCRDKTSPNRTVGISSSDGAVGREQDRRPSGGECVTTGAVTPVSATISGLREAVRARKVAEAAARARSFSESS